jgi:hypothetical protein
MGAGARSRPGTRNDTEEDEPARFKSSKGGLSQNDAKRPKQSLGETHAVVGKSLLTHKI